MCNWNIMGFKDKFKSIDYKPKVNEEKLFKDTADGSKGICNKEKCCFFYREEDRKKVGKSYNYGMEWQYPLQWDAENLYYNESRNPIGSRPSINDWNIQANLQFLDAVKPYIKNMPDWRNLFPKEYVDKFETDKYREGKRIKMMGHVLEQIKQPIHIEIEKAFANNPIYQKFNIHQEGDKLCLPRKGYNELSKNLNAVIRGELDEIKNTSEKVDPLDVDLEGFDKCFDLIRDTWNMRDNIQQKKAMQLAEALSEDEISQLKTDIDKYKKRYPSFLTCYEQVYNESYVPTGPVGTSSYKSSWSPVAKAAMTFFVAKGVASSLFGSHGIFG